VPKEIWRVCQALIDSRQSYGNQLVIMESEITTDESSAIRIRTRWFNLDDAKHPHILVTLEDKNQSTQSLAIAEAKKYDLTPREAEIWSLRRANYSYKQIAAKLYITLNTVKKHVKNIRAKQELIMSNC
jgi:DNA-binding CsgD family transcriptional regulator